MTDQTPRPWTEIAPADATEIDLSTDLTITAPLNEDGERCPWPWEPQQLVGAPMGQYHCGYCGAMVMAGVPHIDYAESPAAAAAGETPRSEVVIKAGEIELDGGDVMLQELSVGDPIEIEKQTGPLGPGCWVITAFEADDRSRARVRRLTREEIEAARRGEAFSRIYE